MAVLYNILKHHEHKINIWTGLKCIHCPAMLTYKKSCKTNRNV